MKKTIALFILSLYCSFHVMAGTDILHMKVDETRLLSFNAPPYIVGTQWTISDMNAIEFVSKPGAASTMATIKAISPRRASNRCIVHCTYYYRELDPTTGRYEYQRTGYQDWEIIITDNGSDDDDDDSSETLIIPSCIRLSLDQSTSITPDRSSGEVSWTNSNPNVISLLVTDKAYINAISPGISYVTATINNTISSTCKVIVYPSKCSISANINGGIVSKGTKIRLQSDAEDCDIFYTLDGSNPTRNSLKYQDGLTISNDCCLKAFATSNFCEDSEIMTCDFKITTLMVNRVLPENVNISKNTIPVIEFNDEISKGINFSNIQIYDNETILYSDFIISENKLFCVPLSESENKHFKIFIPESALTNTKGESNCEYTTKDFYYIPSQTNIRQIVAGNNNSAIILNDNSLWMVGKNAHGMFGNGTTQSYTTPTKVHDRISNVSLATDYMLVDYYTTNNVHQLLAAGINACFQLGIGGLDESSTLISPYDNFYNPRKFSAGDRKAAVITENGEVYNWGTFNGSSKEVSTKKKLSKLPIDIKCGAEFVIALLEDHSLWGWGHNSNGELGLNNYTANINTPEEIIKDIVTYSCGPNFTLAIDQNGDLWSWGSNFDGNLGDGSKKNVRKPKKVLDNVKSAFCGGNSYSLIIKKDNSLWGSGDLRIFSNVIGIEESPIFVKIMDDVKDASCSSSHSFITLIDGDILAMGDNSNGELCLGHTNITETPSIVTFGLYDVEDFRLKQTETTLNVGDKCVILTEILPKNASYLTIEWESSNNQIVDVKAPGICEAISEGEASIQATIVKNDGDYIQQSLSIRVNGAESAVNCLNKDKSDNYIIYDIYGRRIKDNNITPPNGLYLKLYNGNAKKIIINHQQ